MYLVCMILLMAVSAFFSSSEAAFFSLSIAERFAMKQGNSLDRLAASLTDNLDQLLSTILFGNLVVNLLYFTISTVWSLQLQRAGHPAEAGMVAVGALLGMIVFAEMLPKDVAVLKPRFIANLACVPLFAVHRILSSFFPIFHTVNLLTRRLFLPNFAAEPELQSMDPERAVVLSKEDATLLRREQIILLNIVRLSELWNEELMRPRTLLKSFPPTVTWEILAEHLPPESDFVWITEKDTDELAAAVPLTRMKIGQFVSDKFRDGIHTPDGIPKDTCPSANELVMSTADNFPVLYVPWRGKVAAALETMLETNVEAAVVLNEYGETVGSLVLSDILETVYVMSPSRSRRLLNRSSIARIRENLWRVTGITSLRRLEKRFRLQFPEHRSTTVSGLMTEILERLPESGDTIQWGGFQFHVVESDADRIATIEVSRLLAM